MRYYFRFRFYADLSVAACTTLLLIFIEPRLGLFRDLDGSARESFGLALFSTSATLLGFVLAASTFLISHIQHPRFAILRNADSYGQLPDLVGSNLWRLALTSICGCLVFFIDDKYSSIALLITAFLITWELVAFAAVLWVIIKIYKIPLRQ
jgi:hypothetical protein